MHGPATALTEATQTQRARGREFEGSSLETGELTCGTDGLSGGGSSGDIKASDFTSVHLQRRPTAGS